MKKYQHVHNIINRRKLGFFSLFFKVVFFLYNEIFVHIFHSFIFEIIIVEEIQIVDLIPQNLKIRHLCIFFLLCLFTLQK